MDKRMNRRGQTGFEEVLYVLVYIFGAAIFLFLLYYIFTQINSPISTALSGALPANETSFNVTKAGTQTLGGLGLFNNLFPLLIVGLIIMVAVSAMFIQSHPIFFFIGLIVLGVVVMLGAIFSNIYQQISTDTNFGTTSTNFNIMNIFMKFLPLVIAIVIIIVAIVIYAKPGAGGNQGL